MQFVLRYAASATLFLAFSAGMTALAADRVDVINRDRSSLALKGYDPVAYFQQGRSVKGTSLFSYRWMDSTWHFASAESRDLFASDPQKYAPQYGAYCSWAVSRGYTADTDPDAWKIVDGKLYLNYSKSVQRKWETDIPGNIRKADGNWPSLHK